MQRIALLAVYLGHVPAYLPLWLSSCAWNTEIDFFLLTNHPEEVPYIPDNVTVVPTDLQSLRDRFSELLGFPACLENAYKLCDYKPLLGPAFADMLASYDFWGHVDLDIFWGRLRTFFPAKLESYPRAYHRGHLSLYRNDAQGRTLFRLPNTLLDWQIVFRSPDYFHFDEVPGVALALQQNDMPLYADHRSCADINWKKTRVELTRPDLNHPPQVFTFDRGRVLQVYWENDRIGQREFAYLHFQKRRIPALPAADWRTVDQWTFTAHGVLLGLPQVKDRQSLAALDRPNYSHLVHIGRSILRRTIKIVQHAPHPGLKITGDHEVGSHEPVPGEAV